MNELMNDFAKSGNFCSFIPTYIWQLISLIIIIIKNCFKIIIIMGGENFFKLPKFSHNNR